MNQAKARWRRPFLGAGVVLLAAGISVATAAPADSCAVLVSPRVIGLDGFVRVLAAAETPLPEAAWELRGPGFVLPGSKPRNGGGPPYWWSAEFKINRPGAYTVSLSSRGKTVASRSLSVPLSDRRASGGRSVWPVERGWDGETEALYAAWIDALFHDGDERSSWKALHDVLRDPARNVLHDHLGLGEDDSDARDPLLLRPDCADNPFFLRAYFAWKLGLPFGFHECSRGTLRRPPACDRWISNLDGPSSTGGVRAFRSFLGRIMNAIHSASGRTALGDDETDLYPVALDRSSLRPGVVFADPYGHTLVLVRWLDQTPDRPGGLLAVDAQPDGTVGLKRFWRGNFLFAASGVVGGPGFKAFRPIVLEAGRPRLLRNDEIAGSGAALFSLEQKGMESELFYDRMDRLINPAPLDPAGALRDLLTALHEQLLVRVTSVANGEEHMKAHPGTVIPMPSTGPAVFLTVGPWEDFATPNRDMRLLIAMDAVLGFMDRFRRTPDRFRRPRAKDPERILDELRALHKTLTREMVIRYSGSDGTERVLTLEEILNRREAFEMAYNPNDGIEIRWGAPEGSPEYAACTRRAPAPQRERMKALRPWFAKRLHPVE